MGHFQSGIELLIFTPLHFMMGSHHDYERFTSICFVLDSKLVKYALVLFKDLNILDTKATCCPEDYEEY